VVADDPSFQVHRPRFQARLLSRVKLVGGFATVQLLAQGLGIAAGILLVRTLSRQEYAYFTLANTMQGTMNILADTGLSVGLSSIGGKVSSDPYRFGQLIATTLRLRLRFAIAAIALVVPPLVLMLLSKGASYPMAGALTLAVLSGLGYQLTIGVLTMVPRFLSQIRRIQLMDVSSALLRLALLAGAYFIYLNAVTAVMASVAALALQHALLKRWVADGIDRTAPPNEDDRAALLKIVKSLAPSTIFYCLHGQLTILLLGLFGSTKSIAEVGALGRLAVILSVIGSVMSSIVLPRFASYRSAQMVRRRFVQITGGFVLLGLALVAAALLLPGPFLWVLGKNYSQLQRELPLMMVQTALTSIAMNMWSLNSSRGWIEYVWVNIPATILVQAVGIALLDVSTVRGVLLLGSFAMLPSIGINIVIVCRGLRAEAIRERG
jgi:O-antigen/teichoic acid export membrane protein